MAKTDDFRHQRYSSATPSVSYRLLTPSLPPRPGSEEFWRQMRDVGRRLRAANVGTIYLVHGTFVGDDALGINHALDAYLPRLADWSRRRVKRTIDRLLGDTANYSPQFARLLKQSINEPQQPAIRVRRFNWSGMNNHIGRAEAAVRLIDQLQRDTAARGKRILIWGHSHAGNVMALMTGLFGSYHDSVRGFFHAAEVYFPRRDDIWGRVQRALLESEEPLIDAPLDLVTFGTPIRYGWDARGYSKLLHFVNHRPPPTGPPYLTRPATCLTDMLRGQDGDYIHQLGIAGTNFSTPLLPQNWLADRRLHKLLTPGQHWYQIFQDVRHGMRVAEEGTTLLVAYPPEPSRWIGHFFGHAIYTQRRWMLFHAEEIASRLY